MYGLKISALAALAASLHTAAAAPPACLLACVAQVEKASKCDSLSDLSCICSTTQGSAVEKCLEDICPNGDADAAKSAFTASCGGELGSSSAVASASASASSEASSAVSSAASAASSAASSAEAAESTAAESSAAETTAETTAETSAAETTAETTAAAASTVVTSATSASSSATASVVPSGAANQLGQSFGAVAVVGIVGALL